MAIIKIVPGASFDQQLSAGTIKYGSIALNNKLALNFKSIASEIGDYIGNVFNSTEVAKSLRGQGGEDLPAHLGLSDSLANGLVDGMLDLIKGSVTIGFTTVGDRGTINIMAIETDWSKYLDLPGARYVSVNSKKGTSIEIPVAEWLLVSPDIDVGQASYNIVFSGGNYDSAIARHSRSGRAIMLELKAIGGTTGYVLPDIISKAGGLGHNFIEMAIGVEGVAQKVAEICINKLK